ncbi:MAG: tetratricopeptide repeat protein [Pseudomonadota bacterium]
MKDFFRRRQARLDPRDLGRYHPLLIEDLTEVLAGYSFRIELLEDESRLAGLSAKARDALERNVAYTEETTGRIVMPAVHQGAPLAVISAEPPRRLSPPAFPERFLTAFIRLSLDKILLFKINSTDHETGLNNEDYFGHYLRKRVETSLQQGVGRARLMPLRMGDREVYSGVSVVLAEIGAFDRLAAEHGRLEAVRALTALAGQLKNAAPGQFCLARLDKGRLGMALPQQDGRAAEDLALKALAGIKEEQGRTLPSFRAAFGLACFPLDFSDEINQLEEPDGPGGSEERLAVQLLEKAELALNQAVNNRGRPVFTFRDVLARGGRVVQCLPFNRVVVNLGRFVGAREGQVFTVGSQRPDGQVEFKGEATLFDVRDDFSLGQVTSLRHSLSRVQPGDALIMSRNIGEDPTVGDQGRDEHLDPLLGIPDHAGWVNKLAELVETEDKFAVTLIQVDGYDQYRTTMGQLESDRQLRSLLELIRDHLPEGALLGRFSSESLAVLLLGAEPDQARQTAESWRDLIAGRLRQTCSFGTALFPCGPFGKIEIVSNAQKALEHAAFLGRSSTAVFDSISLNISGDKLFEAGDLDGAVEEYLTALELNPEDQNVLNSLGVCYGFKKLPDHAVEVFDRVLALNPDNMMAHYNKGFVFAMNHRHDEARAGFRRAAELEPTNFDVLFQLGKVALDLDLVEEALAAFQAAASLGNKNPIVFRYLGQTLLRAGQKEAALDAFKASVRFDPEDAPSLSQLGVLFLEGGKDLDVALSLIRQSVQLDRTNVHFRRRLARALALTGAWAEAEREYLCVLEMGAGDREVFFELGEVVRDLGRPEEARRWFGEALNKDREFKPALEALLALGA